MKYYIANFKSFIPDIPGLNMITSYDRYQIITLDNEDILSQLNGVRIEEISEYEGTVAWKWYGVTRGYRKTYSDLEGLEPDPEELVKGQRRTKVYITPENEVGAVQLMKRVFKNRVKDEFDTRSTRDTEQEILNRIDSCLTIADICILREELLDIEMPKDLAIKLDLWDMENNKRKKEVDYIYGF